MGDLDLYLWVNRNPKPIPGSVQVSGTGYPDPQVKYLCTCGYLSQIQVLTSSMGTCNSQVWVIQVPTNNMGTCSSYNSQVWVSALAQVFPSAKCPPICTLEPAHMGF